MFQLEDSQTESKFSVKFVFYSSLQQIEWSPLHWEKQPALPSILIQTLISSRYTLTDTLRSALGIIFN